MNLKGLGSAACECAATKNRTMKHILLATLVAAASLGMTNVSAHGARAKHGGTVATANDVAFELVAQADGVVIYVEDHDKPVATTGMSGKLTVLNGSEKSEAELKPAGDNRLEAKGVKAAPGARAVAALTTPSQKAMTVRFTVK